jgi:hypothetical protein
MFTVFPYPVKADVNIPLEVLPCCRVIKSDDISKIPVREKPMVDAFQEGIGAKYVVELLDASSLKADYSAYPPSCTSRFP